MAGPDQGQLRPEQEIGRLANGTEVGRGAHPRHGLVVQRHGHDGVRAAALAGGPARGVTGLQVQPLGATRRAAKAGDRSSRRRGGTGRPGAPIRPGEGDPVA